MTAPNRNKIPHVSQVAHQEAAIRRRASLAVVALCPDDAADMLAALGLTGGERPPSNVMNIRGSKR